MGLLWRLTFNQRILSILQLFLVGERGHSPESANLVLSLSRLAAPLGVLLGGWLADRYNTLAVLRVCLVAHAASLATMSCSAGPLLHIACAVQAVSIATLFPALFKQLALLYPLRLQPIVLSLILPPAGFSANALVVGPRNTRRRQMLHALRHPFLFFF